MAGSSGRLTIIFSSWKERGDIHVCTRASIDNERRLREGSLYPESHNCSPFSARTSLINQSSPMAFRPLFRRAATEKQPPSMPPRRTSPTSNSNSFLSLLLPPPPLSPFFLPFSGYAACGQLWLINSLLWIASLRRDIASLFPPPFLPHFEERFFRFVQRVRPLRIHYVRFVNARVIYIESKGIVELFKEKEFRNNTSNYESWTLVSYDSRERKKKKLEITSRVTPWHLWKSKESL